MWREPHRILTMIQLAENLSNADGCGSLPLAPGSPSVAALFVEDGGAYFGLPHVDPWPESRDARAYAGPLPVVAHPPCQRWGKMWFGQPLTVKLTGVRKKKGR